MAARNLTLTEELERLEQSITLTLQEIDHNFSRAHRIITSSILPIVSDYAKHSDAVWEGSKFWKQFFEASANVSLSGYEEADLTASMSHDETETEESSTATPKLMRSREQLGLSSGERNQMTPGQHPASFAQYPSPYEALKREVHGAGDESPDGASTPMIASPTTPAKGGAQQGQAQALPDMSMTPESSPFAMPSSAVAPSTQKHRGNSNTNNDPLLHRVLDKTYRIAATPHTQRRQRAAAAAGGLTATPGTATRGKSLHSRFTAMDSSPMSSPDVPAPQLRAELFSSPMKGPRTPGISVQTPGLKKKFADRDAARTNATTPGEKSTFMSGTTSGATGGIRRAWESDSDEDDEFFGEGYSPPKTMQFHIPQSRLLQTPAREASKRIVEDLLLTAGGDITETTNEDSPSVVRQQVDLDESF